MRRYKRWVTMVTMVSTVTLVLSLSIIGWHEENAKSIRIIFGTEVHTVRSSALDVAQMLQEQGIEVQKTDRINVAMGQSLSTVQTIVIERSFPIGLKLGNETTIVYVTATRVRDVLHERGVRLGAKDRVSKSLQDRVKPYDTIEIVRVKTVETKKQRPIAFATVRKGDPTIPEGREIVLQEGRSGVAVQRVTEVYENGRLIRTQSDKTIKNPQQDRIIAVGTKKIAPKPEQNRIVLASMDRDETMADPVMQIRIAGKNVPVLKVLDNVELTAYTANKESTGKSPGQAGYGKTKTGTIVREGRTIAVDPNVIPLGWWVHIEGIGLRRAEDVGRSIEGNEIDVYMRRVDQAKQFGRREGHTVYVIGPRLPSQSNKK